MTDQESNDLKKFYWYLRYFYPESAKAFETAIYVDLSYSKNVLHITFRKAPALSAFKDWKDGWAKFITQEFLQVFNKSISTIINILEK